MWVIIATVIVTGILGFFIIDNYLRSLKIEDFTSKYVFITGCDSGFGKLLSLRLNKLGFHVISGCLSQKGADDLKQLCPEKLSTVVMDVTIGDNIEKAFNFVKELLPHKQGLWAVVNNAGIAGNASPIEMSTKQDFVSTLEVNLYGPIEIAKRFLPLVRQAQGRVVTITSIMGRYAAASGPYCTSKFGLEGFCDVLRRETYRQGVKVSIIEPGYFRTDILNHDKITSSISRSYKAASQEVKDTYGLEVVNKMSYFLTEITAKASTDLDHVVSAYVHAITARFPKTRYVVGNDAKFFFVPLSMLPDWFGDWIIQTLMRLQESKMKMKK